MFLFFYPLKLLGEFSGEVLRNIMCSKAIVPVEGRREQMGKTYPAAMATHDQVVKSPTIFWDTLQDFHSKMGTKFMVPVIGGKELNLHLLYAQVTRRGGYEKVVELKKWREVSSDFHFSATTTSASYALRKHYCCLLRDYEQVYFFSQKGPMLPHSTTGPVPFQAVGTINGKFDCGYLVSVKLGSEVLNGILYHPCHPESYAPQASAPPPPCTTDAVMYNQQPKCSGRKRRRRRQDPNHPKPNRSGYNFFFAERHSMLKSLHPNREREFTKMIGDAWNNLSHDERLVYQNYGLNDKERYQREMKEYRERLNLQNST